MGKYDDIINMLEQTLINAEEAVNEIEAASRNISLNQNELDSVEERIFTLRSVARKHQVNVDELPEVLEKFRQQLNAIELGEDGAATAMATACDRMVWAKTVSANCARPRNAPNFRMSKPLMN